MSPRAITEDTLFYGDNLPVLRQHSTKFQLPVKEILICQRKH
jgi:hypothetical protein